MKVSNIGNVSKNIFVADINSLKDTYSVSYPYSMHLINNQ